MAEPVLYAARVVPGIGQGVPAGVTQHVARVDDIVLLDHPADASGPRSIDCYSIAEHSTGGTAFKLDPARLVYSLRRLHNAEPPDFELVLMQQDVELWERCVSAASLILLAELRRRAPEAIDWAGMPEVIPVLDAFEEATESKTAPRH